MTPQDLIAIVNRAGFVIALGNTPDEWRADFAEDAELQGALDELQVAEAPAAVLSGRDAVLKMRDEFLQLVTVYNAVGLYKNAQHAQAMAIALHEFEDSNNITPIVWPAVFVNDPDNGPGVQTVEGNHISSDEL